MSEKPTGQEPNAGGQEPQPGGQEPQAEGQEPEAVDMSMVRKLRAEAAEYRRKLRELEETERKRKEAEMSELEKVRAHLADYERREADWQRTLQDMRVRHEVQAHAAKLGIVDPEAAYRLLDLATLEFDDDGAPKGVDKVLQALLRDKPYLHGQVPVGPTNPANPARTAQTFTRSQLRDVAFFEQNKDAIMQAAREGRILEG